MLSRGKDSFIGKGKGFNTATLLKKTRHIIGEKIIRFLKEAISIEIFRKTQLQCKSQINGKNITAYYLAWLNCSKLSTNPFFKQINVVSSVCVVWKSKKTCQCYFSCLLPSMVSACCIRFSSSIKWFCKLFITINLALVDSAFGDRISWYNARHDPCNKYWGYLIPMKPKKRGKFINQSKQFPSQQLYVQS